MKYSDAKNAGEGQWIIKYDKRARGRDPLQGDREEIIFRTDPLFSNPPLYASLISPARRARPSNNGAKEPRKETCCETEAKEDPGCDFCKSRVLKETSGPRINHGIFGIRDVDTFSNLYPFIEPHYVTAFSSGHKSALAELTQEDFERYLLSGIEIAEQLKADGLDGMWDFINFGKAAGGSQKHAHAQRGGLYPFMLTMADEEAVRAAARKKEWGRDPFEVYINFMHNNNMIISNEKDGVAFAAYAPMFDEQIDVYTAPWKKISNYLDMDIESMKEISRIMAVSVGRLSKREDNPVTALNIVAHQARFGNGEDYRLHWHVYPRARLINGEEKVQTAGGMELSRNYIISAEPENTAREFREIFRQEAEKEEKIRRLASCVNSGYNPCGQCAERLTGVGGNPCEGCRLSSSLE